MASANTNTFITYTFPSPVSVPGGSFFIGDMTPAVPTEWRLLQALDETSTAVRSWVAGMIDGSPADINNIGNNDFLGTIDSFGLPGNWLIRAESGPLGLARVVSEKNGWDINLLNGTGVEDRSGGSEKEYSLRFAFSTPLASVGGATTSCGSVVSFVIDPTDASRVEVDLTGVDCNESEITVSLNDVADMAGDTLSSVPVTFGLLIGDVNGDGTVNLSDYRKVKSHVGELVNKHNFRSDVSFKDPSHIDISDLNLVKQQRGTHLP
jgi:hypothetical protein